MNTFLELIKVGSFSQTAKNLYLSQSAVSQQIRKLEKEIGCHLIVRRKMRYVSMSEAGRRLYRFAEHIRHEHNNLCYEIQQFREELGGNLVITASSIPSEFILPKILSGFKEQCPVADIKVEVSTSLEIIEDIQSGIYEVGFSSVKPDDEELEYFKMAEDEIVLIVFPSHPFSFKKEIVLSELAGESFALREEDLGYQNAISLLSEAGFEINQCSPKLVLGTNTSYPVPVQAYSNNEKNKTNRQKKVTISYHGSPQSYGT
ncbi:LysR substrate-binding domain-containing protein [Chloroflexota bacterium]